MLESFKRNYKGILLMLASACCVCFGQLLWKLSADGELLMLLFGFILYGMGALIMLIAYKFGKVSVLQPILATSYIISIILAHFVLGEDISLLNIAGVLLIMLGVVLVAGGDKE